MRTITSTLLLLAIAGCAHNTPEPTARAYEASNAPGLVFDSPITMNEQAPDLSRDARERAAFVGFEQPTVSFFYLRFEDRDRGDGLGRTERRVVQQRYGIGYR